MSKVISTSRHEAIVVKDDSSDVMKHCKIACAQVKAKHNIDKFVTPISWTKMPFGSVVVVEVPSGISRCRSSSDAGGKNCKLK